MLEVDQIILAKLTIASGKKEFHVYCDRIIAVAVTKHFTGSRTLVDPQSVSFLQDLKFATQVNCFDHASFNGTWENINDVYYSDRSSLEKADAIVNLLTSLL